MNNVKEELKNNYLNLFLGNGLFVLSAFPYISFYHLPSDTQPLALFFAIMIFTIYVKKKNTTMPVQLWLLLLLFLYAILVFFVKSDFFFGLRSLAGYASIFLIAFASYKTYKYLDFRIFSYIIYIWLIFGLIQLVYDRTFGDFLLPRLVSTAWRGGGVNSLAVEPSIYAIICLFFLIFNDFFYQNGKCKRKEYIFLNIILIFQIFISYSGTGFIFMAIYFALKVVTELLKNRTYSYIIYYCIGIIIIVIVMTNVSYFMETRPGILLSILFHDPLTFFFNDRSLADRLLHIVLPFISLFYSKGLGFGLGTWERYSGYLIESMGGVFAALAEIEFSRGGRIMSGWGTPVFELGIIGILYPLCFLSIVAKGLKINRKLFTAILPGGITIFLIIINAVPIAFPLLGYFSGMILYYACETKEVYVRSL